jgi:predicted phosphodiesterase
MPTHNVEMVGPNGKIFKLLKEGKRKYQKIIQIGDLVCFDDFSAHRHIPGQEADALETFRLVKEFNINLRKAAPKADIYYVEGNHEIRLERYLVRQAPQLLPLNCLTIQALFELDKQNIKWKPYRQRLFIDGLKVTHGTICRPESGYTAHGELKKAKYNTGVSGHCHRLGFVKANDVAWMELGHLGDPDYSKHQYLGDGDANWNAGFGEGTCCIDDTTGKHYWFLKPIEIKDQNFIVDGVCY